MGQINIDAQSSHFRIYPEQIELANALLTSFDLNRAERINTYRTHINCFLLSPDKTLSDSFGFEDEILLVYSTFQKIEPRIIQAIEYAFSQQPYRARANPLVFILVTKDPESHQWIERYLTDHPQFRTPVIIPYDELISNKLNKWYIRNKFSNQLFSRDIFDYQLPLDKDLYFFGRKSDCRRVR